jgi:hypothetical protein
LSKPILPESRGGRQDVGFLLVLEQGANDLSWFGNLAASDGPTENLVQQAGQDFIDGEKIILEVRQIAVLAHLGGGDAEIEIDVGIHAKQQVV